MTPFGCGCLLNFLFWSVQQTKTNSSQKAMVTILFSLSVISVKCFLFRGTEKGKKRATHKVCAEQSFRAPKNVPSSPRYLSVLQGVLPVGVRLSFLQPTRWCLEGNDWRQLEAVVQAGERRGGQNIKAGDLVSEKQFPHRHSFPWLQWVLDQLLLYLPNN